MKLNLFNFKEKNTISLLLITVFILLIYIQRNHFFQNDIFFLDGDILFKANLIKFLIFFYFIPIVYGAGIAINIIYKKIYKKLQIKRNTLEEFLYLSLMGFSSLSIFGAILGHFGLLNYKLIIIVFSINIFLFVSKVKLPENRSKLIVSFLVLTLLAIYKYIYPESWSADSHAWYLNYTNTISYLQSGARLLDGEFYHNWYLLRGSGTTLMFIALTDGDATRMVSVYCLFLSSLFIYSILNRSYSKLTNTKTLSYIIFFSSLLFIFTKASFAEFQKYHYLTLFFISSFYWILVNFKNKFLVSLSSPFLLVLGALILDKYHNAFFAGLLFLFYYLLFEKKNFKNFIHLTRFSLICLMFVSLSLFYNYVFAGQLDAWLWELPLNLKNNIVTNSYFDENLLKFWTWEYNEYRLLENQAIKDWFSWFDVFNLPILIIWYVWGILALLILCYEPSRKLFFSKSRKNYRYINFLLPLIFFTFIILLAQLSSISFNVTSIRRALQVFSLFFAYLSFIITILFVIEFIVKNNFLNLKKYIQGLALTVLTLVFLGSIIKFDRDSNYKTGLPDNSFNNIRQIKYFLGKIGIKETVDRSLSFELCKQVDNLFKSKTKILTLSNIGKDCRLPNKNIKIFKANYNDIKLHLFGSSKNSLNLLKKNNYGYFVFFFDFKKNDNFFVMDDLSIYYKAFELDFLMNNFYVYKKSKNYLLLSTNPLEGKQFKKEDIELIKKIIKISKKKHWFEAINNYKWQ